MHAPITEVPSPLDPSGIIQDLLQISNLVGSVMVLDEILDQVSTISVRLLRAQACSIYLCEPSSQQLVLRAAYGLNREMIGKATIALGEGIKGWAAEHNQLVAVADCRTDERWKPVPGTGEEAYVSLLCCPLRIQEEVIGVMTARRTQVHEWTQDEIGLFETVCKQVAIVLEKSRLYFEKVESDRLAGMAVSISEVAHYIKNVLQGMQGGQYFVDSGLKRNDLERVRQGWDMLLKNVQKIENLVQNMLSYSRSSKLHLEPESLNGLLYELAAQLEDMAERRRVNLRTVLDDTIPELMLSYDTLHEAFQNLLINAIEAIGEGKTGIVELNSRLDLAKGVARVTIRDTGSGIPPEHQKRIFTLFFSTKGRRGTGIGLAVTKKIIEEHGASIRYESEMGKGTVFIVELPLRPPAA